MNENNVISFERRANSKTGVWRHMEAHGNRFLVSDMPNPDEGDYRDTEIFRFMLLSGAPLRHFLESKSFIHQGEAE